MSESLYLGLQLLFVTVLVRTVYYSLGYAAATVVALSVIAWFLNNWAKVIEERKKKERDENLAGAAFAGILAIGLFAAMNPSFGATKMFSEKAPETSLSPKRYELRTDNVPVMEFVSASAPPVVEKEEPLSPEEKLQKAFLKRESEFKSASDEPTLSELAKACFQEVGGILIEEEWMLTPGKSNEGKGDLVFEFNGFHYVVECKHLSQLPGHNQHEHRRQGRHKVIEQANRYAEEWPNYRKKYRPDLLNTAPVLAYIVTNEEGLESARM